MRTSSPIEGTLVIRNIQTFVKKQKKLYTTKNDLHTYTLQYYYNHIFVGHFRQNKTLELIYCNYAWLSLHIDIKKFCNSYITCMRSKPQCHKLYKTLKQLPISK